MVSYSVPVRGHVIHDFGCPRPTSLSSTTSGSTPITCSRENYHERSFSQGGRCASKECESACAEGVRPIRERYVNIFFSFTSVTELKQESSRIRGMHARPISLTAMGM